MQENINVEKYKFWKVKMQESRKLGKQKSREIEK